MSDCPDCGDCGDCDCGCSDADCFALGCLAGSCCDGNSRSSDGAGCLVLIIILIIVGIALAINSCGSNEKEYKVIEVTKEKRIFAKDDNTLLEDTATKHRIYVRGNWGKPGTTFKHVGRFE